MIRDSKTSGLKMIFEKKEVMRLLQVQVTSRHCQCEEDSSSTSTDENEILAKKPRLFGFIAAGSKKEKI